MAATDSASIIDLYDSLLAAEDERARARIIANAFERLEDRYPELRDMVTASGMRESELRLQQEIEKTRLRIEEVRAELGKEIERFRADLSKEIEQVRADLGRDIEHLRADLTREIAQGNQKVLRWTTALMFAQIGAILAAIIGVHMM
jgi:Zn-dependent M32 family carboxypeptidase